MTTYVLENRQNGATLVRVAAGIAVRGPAGPGIDGNGVTEVVILTQAQYDAMKLADTLSSTTLYLTTI